MSDCEFTPRPSSGRTSNHSALPVCVVVVLLRSESARRRVEAAFGRTACVVGCSTIRQARAALGERLVTAILLEAHDAEGVPTGALVQDVVRLFPRTALLACVPRSGSLSQESLALVRSGVHDVLLAEDLDLAFVVRRVVNASRLRCLADALWPQLAPLLDEVLAPFLRYALEHAATPLDVRAVAAALGAHRKTLWERCRAHGVPGPRELLSWCRLLAAAYSLDDQGRTIDSIAHELDFPSPSALRNLMQRYLRLTPNECRARGGSSYAVRCLAERLQSSVPLRRALGPRRNGGLA
jgi:AraC-like DNA-binding protein